VLPHETKRNWKPLFETVESDTLVWQIGGSDFGVTDRSQGHRRLRRGAPTLAK
jgi:hypothetical protein